MTREETDHDARPLPKHLHLLDSLRGVAALCVVLWHWQHFSYGERGLEDFDVTSQPLFSLFGQIYTKGFLAVELFFTLSGFIFYWLYSSRIAAGKVSAYEFTVLRLSRLYPLHLLTLLIVAAGQAVFVRQHGWPFVYPTNDLRHFVLQLFFASNWGFHSSETFNGPIWSVSAEVLLYIAFFAACRAGLTRWWHLLAFLVLADSMSLLKLGDQRLMGAFFSFFAGGLAYYVVDWARRPGIGRFALWPLIALAVASWLVFLRPSLLDPWEYYERVFPMRGPTLFGRRPYERVIFHLPFLGLHAVLFPSTVAVLALIECRVGSIFRRFAVLGQISYSSYLIHFPLQLGFVLVGGPLAPGGFDSDRTSTLGLFFVLLIALSLASYWFFELPAQRLIRARLLGPGGVRIADSIVSRIPRLPGWPG